MDPEKGGCVCVCVTAPYDIVAIRLGAGFD